MLDVFDKVKNAIVHLEVLHSLFINRSNFSSDEKLDFDIYRHNDTLLSEALAELEFGSQLYNQKGRQMMLADLLEYIFLARGYYCIGPKSTEERQIFIKAILRFVNLLMGYEMMTVSDSLRRKFLKGLGNKIADLKDEPYYDELKSYEGKVGLPKRDTDAPSHLNRYFDSLLPKTAGGLWHELLVFVFLLRNNIGYIIPLLLSQRLMSRGSSIIPPDFLVITADKSIYGVEVGTKKEIQSGSFSLQTRIPTATLDTENSRVSDRCPICKRWIPFCDFVIDTYSDFHIKITGAEVRCLEKCNIYSREDIVSGECPYTKYSRHKTSTLEHTKHKFADGLHYHYRCVLSSVSPSTKNRIVIAKDSIALKAHYPYYSGLETLESE